MRPKASELPDFSALTGWAEDAHDAALALWLRTNPAELARRLEAPSPSDGPELARRWWEAKFRPLLVGDPARSRLTAYYEPVIDASAVRTPRFTAPLLALPPEHARAVPMPDRGAIMAGAYAGLGLEMYWLKDAVELYFLQLQGSGRLRLQDGRLVRVGFAGRNGHDYASIGRIMMAEGHLPQGGASAGGIKAWLRADRARGAAMMARNPSYVFFREVDGLREDEGPIGAMGLPLSAHRSLAVDTRHHPFGSAIWVEAHGIDPRLMVAMDRGTAIRGPQRGDIFFGTGESAGRKAGRVAARGRLLRLVPVESDA